MSPGASYCGVLGCYNNSRKKPELTYFVVPREETRKKEWVERIGRYDILEKTGSTKYYVCSTHFSREMWNNKRLRPDAVPSMHLPKDSEVPSGSLKYANVQVVRSDQDSSENAQEDPEDDLGSTIIIKEEINDEIVEEEVDSIEQLTRKRQQDEQMAGSSKKIKTEPVSEIFLSPPQIIVQPHPNDSTKVDKESETSNTCLLPEFFMTKMLSTQREIIGILKNQVLLQDPDPALLTFLRFVGAKLQRVDEKERKKLQDKITAILF